MKKLISRAALLLMGALAFTACSDDDNKNTTSELVNVTEGVFVLNEGSYFSGIDGSLSYINYATNQITNGIFASKNGRSLGGTPNDAIIYGSKMYIATTDEGRVEVIDVKTQASLGYATLTQPRKLVADGGFVYVSSYAGTVSRIDTTSFQIVKTSEVIGANLEGITALNGYLYVCNGWNPDYTYNNNVVKLDASTLAKVKDITVVTNPARILTDGTDIYVQSIGNYADVSAAIQKIDAADVVTTLCNEGLYLSYYKGKIYYVATSYDENWNTIAAYKVYDLATGATTTFVEGSEVFSPCALAVDPYTGLVYVSSYSQGAYGSADYAGAGYIVVYNNDGTFWKQYDAGVAPTTYVFNTASYVKTGE